MRRRRDLTDFKISIKLKRLYSTLSTSLHHGLAIGRLFLFFSRAQKVFLVLQLYVSFKSLSIFFARLTFVIFLFDKPLPLICAWRRSYWSHDRSDTAYRVITFTFIHLIAWRRFLLENARLHFSFDYCVLLRPIYQYGKVTILVRISNRTRICYLTRFRRIDRGRR